MDADYDTGSKQIGYGATRTKTSMSPLERRTIIKNFGGVLVLFILGYIILTMIRDVRDNFGVEIWKGLGYGDDASVYTTSEIPATVLLLILLGALYRIKDNKKLCCSISG